jgi:hypothetical protein
MTEIADAKRPLRFLVSLIFDWLDPEEHAAGVVYGIITVGAVIAIEGGNNLPVWHDIGATVIVLVIYWIAHAYSTIMGDLYRTKARWSWPHVAMTLRHERAILRGASIPILAMIAAALLGVRESTVTWTALVAMITLLMAFQVVAGQRAGMRGIALVGQLLVGVFFGVLLVIVRTLTG